MTNQWFITVLGMGTVFLALIALSFIVSLFPKIFGIAGAKKKPEAASKAPPTKASAVSANALDNELVAVIAAAVSAASGLGPEGFRITQLVATQAVGQCAGGMFNTPVWGYADRIGRMTQTR